MGLFGGCDEDRIIRRVEQSNRQQTDRLTQLINAQGQTFVDGFEALSAKQTRLELQIDNLTSSVETMNSHLAALETIQRDVTAILHTAIPEIINRVTTRLDEVRGELMSRADELKQANADLLREVQETKEHVSKVVSAAQAEILSKTQRIEELLAQDADDESLRKAVEEDLPAIRAAAVTLNEIQNPPSGDTGAGGSGGSGSGTGDTGTGDGTGGTTEPTPEGPGPSNPSPVPETEPGSGSPR